MLFPANSVKALKTLHYFAADRELFVSEMLIYFLLLCAVYTVEYVDVNTERVCLLRVHNTHMHSWSYSGNQCLLLYSFYSAT